MILQTDTSHFVVGFFFLRCSEVGERQDKCKYSCFIYQVVMEFTKAIFDCEGLFELGKIRHPTCSLF